jgi:hypothetical protein
MNKITNNSSDLDIKAQHMNGNIQPGSTYKNNSFIPSSPQFSEKQLKTDQI